MTRIAFHSNQLSLRGTEVAMYDYAHFNELLLGNTSLIITPRVAPHHEETALRFATRFPVFGYSGKEELEAIIREQRVDILYCIKSGQNDGILSSTCKTVIHAVFGYCEPHGDVYAYVSEWLARQASQERFPAVPHIVAPLSVESGLRDDLGIPAEAIVFGRHGGAETFDLDFVHITVRELVRVREDLYFLFLGTDRFCDNHPQIIHLDATSDLSRKARFIATCDAMLHARRSGETFGLAIAEFSSLGKPVFTFGQSHERAHLDILGKLARIYDTADELTTLLWHFVPERHPRESPYATRYTPEAVMCRFQEVFIEG